MTPDKGSPEDRELDNLIDSLTGFDAHGLRSDDYVDWADGFPNARTAGVRDHAR